MSGDAIAGYVVLGFVVLIVWLSVRSARRKQAEQRQADDAEARRAQGEIQLYTPDDPALIPNLTDSVAGVILKPGERCCAISEDAQEIVMRKHTQYIGGSRGVSFRVPGMPKSLSPRVHLGRYKGRAESEVTPEVADTGNIYITNLRVVFAGAKEVSSVPIPKVADVRAEGATFEILQENRVKPHVFVIKGFRAAVLRAATIRMIEETNRPSGPKNKTR